MNNIEKRPFHIDSDASTDQVFTLLDAVQSDKKNEIDELMNDFDTECIPPEEIELTDNPGNVSALRLEVSIHVVDQRTTHIKELEKKRIKKARRKYPDHMETQCFSTFSRILFS